MFGYSSKGYSCHSLNTHLFLRECAPGSLSICLLNLVGRTFLLIFLFAFVVLFLILVDSDEAAIADNLQPSRGL